MFQGTPTTRFRGFLWRVLRVCVTIVKASKVSATKVRDGSSGRVTSDWEFRNRFLGFSESGSLGTLGGNRPERGGGPLFCSTVRKAHNPQQVLISRTGVSSCILEIIYFYVFKGIYGGKKEGKVLNLYFRGAFSFPGLGIVFLEVECPHLYYPNEECYY